MLRYGKSAISYGGVVTELRIQVLGPVSAIRDRTPVESVAQNVRHLLGLLAAAGPDGIDREQLASELWQDSPPSSWQSALRNRVTRVRQHIDPDCLIRVAGRLSFSPTVVVDSWDLLDRRVDHAEHATNQLAALEGEVLAGLPASPAVDAHRSAVTESRIGLVQELASAEIKLCSMSLQRVRDFRRRHPENAQLARAAIRTHVLADQHAAALEILQAVESQTEQGMPRPEWSRELERMISETNTSLVTDPVEARHNSAFDTAIATEQWGLAYEIAMAGLPEAERSDGDPERLKKLEAIPIDALNPTYRFSLALALTRNLVFIGREEEARQWARTASELASKPSEELLVYIAQAFVGETDDAREPIPLPKAAEDAPWEELSLQSLQVAVMSHLERSSWERTAPLQARFETLVESSGEPYRRWHLLLLKSMTHFVAGRLTESAAAAEQAHSYASLFDIADADGVLLAQLSNAGVVHAGFGTIEDYLSQFPMSASSVHGRALLAVASAARDDGEAVERFLRTFSHRSRAIFTFPIVALIAPFARGLEVRKEIEANIRRRAGTSIIYGTGALHLGPADRTLARIVDAKPQAIAHLRDAIEVADRQRAPIWQVTCRLDLAAATGQAKHHTAAQTLVDSDGLQTLIDDYESPFS